MYILLPILFILFLAFGIFFLTRKKTECTCIGKVCGSSDGCGNQCCDPSKGEKCISNSCCSADCTGKTCADTNGCGESCTSVLCATGQKCYQGNCCASECGGGCQSDGCGGICTCPQGQVCFQGECCLPDDCSTGVCSSEGKCGQPPCKCNDAYCSPNTCCQNGKCTYEDICQAPLEIKSYLQKQWGQFCKSSDIDPTGSQCEGCSLVGATFMGQALAPVSGSIQCQKCENNGGWNLNPTSVEIDPNVGYYYNSGGEITAGPLRKNFCSTATGGCGTCLCITDDDCIRFGCTSCSEGACK